MDFKNDEAVEEVMRFFDESGSFNYFVNNVIDVLKRRYPTFAIKEPMYAGELVTIYIEGRQFRSNGIHFTVPASSCTTVPNAHRTPTKEWMSRLFSSAEKIWAFHSFINTYIPRNKDAPLMHLPCILERGEYSPRHLFEYLATLIGEESVVRFCRYADLYIPLDRARLIHTSKGERMVISLTSQKVEDVEEYVDAILQVHQYMSPPLSDVKVAIQ